MSNGDLTARNTLSVSHQDGFAVPEQIAAAGDEATERFVEFFIATIRNPNTRGAPIIVPSAASCAWCEPVPVLPELSEV